MALCNFDTTSSLLKSRLVVAFSLGFFGLAMTACDKGDDDPKDETSAGDDDDDSMEDSSGGGDEIPEEFKGKTNPNAADDADAIAAGMTLYSQHCASCHGPQGEGVENLGESLVSATVKGFADDKMLWIVSDGITGTPMAGFSKTLSVDQRWQVITFIRSLAK